MNIGIFSGSFNPIHMGHLMLANYIVEFTDIDEVWFLVTPQNPLKKNKDDLIDQSIRLKMVGEVLSDYPKMKASDFEFNLPIPSYTINTLNTLDETYPQHHFSLIIGADNWKVFRDWKDYQQIIDNFSVLIYPRLGYSINIPKAYQLKIQALDSPIIEISSTFIRESIREGKNVKSFLPESVWTYICNNELYT